MVVSAKEYWSNLFRIKDQNPPSLALLLPSSERTYHIDLNTREVESPEWLSVSKDHDSEVIYFTVNRFFDYMDLSTTVCIIQYINAAGESYYYPVPFYDITTPNMSNFDRDQVVIEGTDTIEYPKHSELMLFPWCISGDATKAAGEIKYSFNFYKFSEDADNQLVPVYSLNTLPATSKILHGMDDAGFDDEGYKFVDTKDNFAYLVNLINENKQQWADGLRWIKA